ncbi:MAG: ATP-binding protein [Marinisporobacter sp.]|jgi:SpoVK/Ycf46/Vps4 family AAA+-type ATPase|nr:ATP-binding protein [Marinisporobacter sp.]
MQEHIYNLFDFKKITEPYLNLKEYYEDQLNLFNIKIIFSLVSNENSTLNSLNQDNEQHHLIINKLTSKPCIFKENTFHEDYSDYLDQCEHYLSSRINLSINHLFIPDLYIANRFNLSFFERNCLLMSFLSSLDSKYEMIFSYYHNSPTKKYLTIETAIILLKENDSLGIDYLEYFQEHNPLMRFFFSTKEEAINISTPLKLDSRIRYFMINPSSFEYEKSLPWSYIEIEDIPDKMIIHHEPYNQVNDFIKYHKINEKPLLINLFGEEGSGRKHLFHHLCYTTKKRGLILDCTLLHDQAISIQKIILSIVKESILQQAYIYLDHIDEFISEQKISEQLYTILSILEEYSLLIFSSSKENTLPLLSKTNFDFQLFAREIPMPSLDDKVKLWQDYTKNIRLHESISIYELSTKFKFTPGQIKNSLKHVLQESKAHQHTFIHKDLLYESCYKQTVHRLKEMATLVKPSFSWNDLVLSESEKKTLIAACNHVKYTHQVFSVWGFEKKLPYGRGLSMLFSGPPGTGKTMSAQIIANELNMEMYKIQLSKIVSKYVGETEKNLKAIFEEANKSNVILFFDETDAIFGKRSDVKDSHDRYANMEVAFLLQEIEAHEGISIMATNFLQNIDDAFLRRINYIIHFPFPDASFRKQIWEKVFPKATPLSDQIDFDFLSGKFELSGSNIKNIAVLSAFSAASENKPISMKHIIQATILEQKKYNKVILSSDLEEYSDFLTNT